MIWDWIWRLLIIAVCLALLWPAIEQTAKEMRQECRPVSIGTDPPIGCQK